MSLWSSEIIQITYSQHPSYHWIKFFASKITKFWNFLVYDRFEKIMKINLQTKYDRDFHDELVQYFGTVTITTKTIQFSWHSSEFDWVFLKINTWNWKTVLFSLSNFKYWSQVFIALSPPFIFARSAKNFTTQRI